MIIHLQVPDNTKRIHLIIVHPGDNGEMEYDNETMYIGDPAGCHTLMKEHQMLSYFDSPNRILAKCDGEKR